MSPFPRRMWVRLQGTHMSLVSAHLNGSLWVKLVYKDGVVCRGSLQVQEDFESGPGGRALDSDFGPVLASAS